MAGNGGYNVLAISEDELVAPIAKSPFALLAITVKAVLSLSPPNMIGRGCISEL